MLGRKRREVLGIDGPEIMAAPGYKHIGYKVVERLAKVREPQRTRCVNSSLFFAQQRALRKNVWVVPPAYSGAGRSYTYGGTGFQTYRSESGRTTGQGKSDA